MNASSENPELRLPGAKVGSPYSYTLEFQEGKCIGIEGLEDAGLQYDAANQELCGTPVQTGTYSIIFRMQPFFGREQLLRGRLAVYPDPRSLWKDLPVPADIPFPKSDVAVYYGKTKNGRAMAGASRRGRSHAHSALPRDDDFLLSPPQEGNGWYIMAVADGAGSAPFSREGARIACETAVSVSRQALDVIGGMDGKPGSAAALLDSVFVQAVRSAYEEIERTAMSSAKSIKVFATTLLLTFACQTPDGWLIASLQIGDGAIAVYSRHGGEAVLNLMGQPDEGEYAGQTRFLTMREIACNEEAVRQRIRIVQVPDFTAVFMMTDGVSDAKFESDACLATPAVWDKLWADLKQSVPLSSQKGEDIGAALAEWLLFWSVGNHDDRTIALLY